MDPLPPPSASSSIAETRSKQDSLASWQYTEVFKWTQKSMFRIGTRWAASSICLALLVPAWLRIKHCTSLWKVSLGSNKRGRHLHSMLKSSQFLSKFKLTATISCFTWTVTNLQHSQKRRKYFFRTVSTTRLSSARTAMKFMRLKKVSYSSFSCLCFYHIHIVLHQAIFWMTPLSFQYKFKT